MPTQTDHDQASLARLAELGAATVYEGLGRVGALDSAIKPLDPTRRLVGPAFTVDCAAGDNLAIHAAMDRIRPGDVLVVDAKAHVEAGPWGDVLTLFAQRRGVAGLVIDGSVRDSADIVEMGFPVFSRGVCMKGTDKERSGGVGVTISCGGVVIAPGDVVVGDADGVTAVPQARVSEALEKAEARQAKEDAMRSAIENGASLADLLNLRDAFARLGY